MASHALRGLTDTSRGVETLVGCFRDLSQGSIGQDGPNIQSIREEQPRPRDDFSGRV